MTSFRARNDTQLSGWMAANSKSIVPLSECTIHRTNDVHNLKTEKLKRSGFWALARCRFIIVVISVIVASAVACTSASYHATRSETFPYIPIERIYTRRRCHDQTLFNKWMRNTYLYISIGMLRRTGFKLYIIQMFNLFLSSFFLYLLPILCLASDAFSSSFIVQIERSVACWQTGILLCLCILPRFFPALHLQSNKRFEQPMRCLCVGTVRGPLTRQDCGK